MDYGLSDAQVAWRERVRAFISEARTLELVREVHEHSINDLGPHARAFRTALAAEGLTGVMWPKAEGGLGLGATELFLMRTELDYFGLAEFDLTYTAIAPMLMRHGTAENREDWLPPLRRGEMLITVGYSEPDAGTDLASLTTKAALDGDEWVINGQKLWNSGAHICTHEWLCVRTDPDAPKHRGLSVIMVPIDSPGIEVQCIDTWGDETTNVTYFTDVRVPRRNLIGEVNKGWQYITGALDMERLAVGHVGELRHALDGLQRWFATDAPVSPVAAETARAELADLEAEYDAAYLTGLYAAQIYDRGDVPTIVATEHKILSSELRQRIADVGTRLLGMGGQLSWRDEDAPLAGELERLYRAAPLLRFGGGANEVLRDVIAQRGQGLPTYGRSDANRAKAEVRS